jgi:hypothetical protein
MNDYSSCRRWCSSSLPTGNDRCCYVHLPLSLGSQSQAKLVSRGTPWRPSIHYERNRDGGIMWWAVIARRDAADAGQMVSHPALTGTGSAALMCRPDRGGSPRPIPPCTRSRPPPAASLPARNWVTVEPSRRGEEMFQSVRGWGNGGISHRGSVKCCKFRQAFHTFSEHFREFL